MTTNHEYLFVRNMTSIAADFVFEGQNAGKPLPPNVREPLGLMRRSDVADSPIHMSYNWIMPTDEPVHWVDGHVHDYDEVLIWTGIDPENPGDLGAVVRLEMDGVPYTFTTSGSVFVPAGVPHCPLGFESVTRPFTFSALSLTSEYTKDRPVPN